MCTVSLLDAECAGSGTTFGRHLFLSCSLHKTCLTQPPSWTYPCSPLNACCREFHCHAKSPLISAHSHLILIIRKLHPYCPYTRLGLSVYIGRQVSYLLPSPKTIPIDPGGFRQCP